MKNLLISGKHKGILYSLISGLIFGSVGILVREVSGLSSLGIAFTRLVSASILLIGFLVVSRRMKSVMDSFSEFKTFSLVGIFASFHIFLFMASLRYTYIANAVLLINTAPAFILVLSPFTLKESFTFQDAAAVTLTFIGSALIIGLDIIHFGGDTMKGDIIALISGLLYALYMLQARKIRQSCPAYVVMFWFYTFGAFVLFMVGILSGSDLSTGQFSARSALFMALLVLLPTIGGHTLLVKSLGYLNASQASNIVLLEVISAAVLAFIIYGEFPGIWSLIGIILALTGIVLSSHSHLKNVDRTGEQAYVQQV